MFSPDEPFFLQWHITDRCDLACTHCYRDKVKPDLPLESLKKIFENFRRLRDSMPQKKARVQIAGGEPLLSEHLFSVLDLVASAGYQSRILTNGVSIDNAAAKAIAVHGCRIVQISIDGDADTHDAVRGAGNYQRAVDGARRLGEHGVEVTFAMTLTRANMERTGAVFEAAKRYAKRVSFHRVVPCGRGAAQKGALLAGADIKRVFDGIYALKNSPGAPQVPLRDPLWKPYIRCPGTEPFVNGCSVGYGGICVESDGDVYPCRRMPIKLGNALTDDLADIWAGEPISRMRDRDLLKGRCGRCPLRWKCGGCRAVAWALNGDAFAEDPQCFCNLPLAESLAYRLVTWMNRAAYREPPGGGA